MTPKKPPYAPGTTMGCFTVIAWEADAPKSNGRLYDCVTTCCGERVVRTGQALIVSQRDGKELCLHCANTRRFPIEQLVRGGFQVGSVVGPVTVIALGEARLYRLVKWSCCGKINSLSLKVLRVMRLRAQAGQVCVCRTCEMARRALRKNEPASPWQAASAVMPEGVIPAAIAWPRPASLRA